VVLQFDEQYQHLIQVWISACRSRQEQSIFARIGEVLSLRYAVVIALSLCGPHSAHGASRTLGGPEDPGQVKRPNWALQITPYIWAPSLDGHISPFQRGPTIGVEKSFSDVMNDLNFGGFVNIWGRHDRFVFSGDIMYVDTMDGHNAGPLPAFRIPSVGVISPGGNISAEINTKQLTATLMGGYRVIDTPQFTLDALGGMRLWHISNDVKVIRSLDGISGSINYGESFSWVDPLIGLRAFVPLTEKLSLQGQADIGGFGADSSFTWSVLATVNYAFSDQLSASVGYKALDVEYDRNGHVYDTRLRGPILGMTYRF
jgi:opacity protein-like surface antigen